MRVSGNKQSCHKCLKPLQICTDVSVRPCIELFPKQRDKPGNKIKDVNKWVLACLTFNSRANSELNLHTALNIFD